MIIQFHKCFISPPFGHYIRFLNWATPIRGTFTQTKRKGIIKNSLTTFRYNKEHESWVNKMGLVNKGINSQRPFNPDHIYSIVGFNIEEWNYLFTMIPSYVNLEINLSCPNIEGLFISKKILQKYIHKFENIIIKTTSTNFKDAFDLYQFSRDNGVTSFHIGNTVKVSNGGLSGRKIQEVSIPLITHIRKTDSSSFIIGGGGIYEPDDVKRYRDAGSNAFSLATIFMTPWKIPAVKKEILKDQSILI